MVHAWTFKGLPYHNLEAYVYNIKLHGAIVVVWSLKKPSQSCILPRHDLAFGKSDDASDKPHTDDDICMTMYTVNPRNQARTREREREREREMCIYIYKDISRLPVYVCIYVYVDVQGYVGFILSVVSWGRKEPPL